MTGSNNTTCVAINVADKVSGRSLFIVNQVSNATLVVYGPANASINGGTANTAYTSAVGKSVPISCVSATSNTWGAIG